MEITYPLSEPNGFRDQSSFYLSTNHSVDQRAAINSDALLFRFYNFNAPSSVEIILLDDEMNGIIARETIPTVGRGGNRFVQFRGFPLRRDQVSPMTMCRYILTLNSANNEAARVDTRVFRHV